jgi:hypothetical protein
MSELFEISYWRLDGGIAAGAKKSSLNILNSSLKSNAEFIANTLPTEGGLERMVVVHTEAHRNHHVQRLRSITALMGRKFQVG